MKICVSLWPSELPDSKKFLEMMAAVAVCLFAMSDSNAADPVTPAGYITIGRDVPAHNAFRAGQPGEPTNVATAREDVVVAGTRFQNQVPQSLPDSALDGVGNFSSASVFSHSSPSGPATASIVEMGSATRGIGAAMGRTMSALDSGVMQAMPTGAGARALAPISNALSAMPGMK